MKTNLKKASKLTLTYLVYIYIYQALNFAPKTNDELQGIDLSQLAV